MAATTDFTAFDPRITIAAGGKRYTVYSVKALEPLGYGPMERLPFSLRILLENLLRHYPQGLASEQDIDNLASWQPGQVSAAAVKPPISAPARASFVRVPIHAPRYAPKSAALSVTSARYMYQPKNRKTTPSTTMIAADPGVMV